MVTTSSDPVLSAISKCEFCGDCQHKNFKCSQFLAITVAQRLLMVRERNVCFNCLRKGHRSANCPSPGTCAKCKKRHHSLLHVETQQSEDVEVHPTKQDDKPNKQPPTLSTEGSDDLPRASTSQVTTVTCATGRGQLPPHVLLMTAVVDVLDKNGNPQPCRILLDSASQVNIITQRMVHLLGVDEFPANLSIAGVDGMQSRSNRGVTVQLRSRYMHFLLNIQCFVTLKVTADLPTSKANVTTWEIPAGIQLADPSFNSPDKVDMLIGNQWFLQLFMSGKIELGEGRPTLCETKLGWVFGGAIGVGTGFEGVVRAQAITIEELSESIQRFWEVESVPQQFQITTDEELCEKHFLATHCRNASGRYVVELPLKNDVNELGDSRLMALRRFFVLEKRFDQQPDLKRQYIEFMDEYERLGHCKEVFERNDTQGMLKWYLPHHAVLRPSNTTTKCRVVFDASARVLGRSLNEMMMVGAICQNDLLAIVLGFRIPQYVLTADVEKMYRQIDVGECHTPLQRIFWRKNSCDPLRVLELKTVTYGTASAPFLATRTLTQLAVDEKLRYPVAAEIVNKCFYVDNALFEFDGIDEAIEAQRQLIEMLKHGGFHLHKWSANSKELMERIPEDDREKLVSIHDSGVNEIIKTLGLMWKRDSDELLYLSLPTSDIEHPTKRQVLSLLSTMFNPLGLAAPVIVLGKLLMQMVWKEKSDWDAQISAALLQQWKLFLSALEDVSQLRIPRRVVAANVSAHELHGFADASGVAYGACVYIRSLGKGSASMKLIASKSRIAPITPLSIPRKELLAALLLHRLVMKVLSVINLDFKEMTLWSDNQPVLAWLKHPPEQLELFVRNRVCEIVSTGDRFAWKYVRSKDNPADVVSRGQAANKLATNDIYWNGPTFLRNEAYRMEIPPPLPIEEIPELKPIVRVHIVTRYEELPVFIRFESFRKLQGVVAYVLRFCRNARIREESRNMERFPTISELRQAMKVIVRVVQNQGLAEEVQRVSSSKPCKKIKNLSPFSDEGILRVGGRLRNTSLTYDVKHQWILPHKHPVVRSLIAAIHRENLHVGPSGVMAIVRQQFWVTNCRNTVRSVIRSCVQCFKRNPRLAEQFMGDLPKGRVERVPAFFDFAGPISIRQGIRKAIPVKGYICVFVCLVTKAIHLEAVENLSTAAFLAALQRFVARRGVPAEIWSDNGTNFVGARNELKELRKLFEREVTEKKVFEFCQTRQIIWRNIPPSAPHFGGLWEAGVKSVKSVLNKILKQATLNIIEFATLLCQIEAILNSRPLFAHSDDPVDEEVLTPGHFLVDRPLTAIPEPSCEEIPVNRRS
ncbi:uncharacterized protein LOC131696195 [Topomyia yanbarensis]|uniref:uncharacterized protein LOC131696195 n=1 Tax=Topomyia yanbarensis TaxID=2498891 RepID=UPI00273B8404|nr:uncharacterized protein LOC131696195 [Topomyia yanbarensis]